MLYAQRLISLLPPGNSSHSYTTYNDATAVLLVQQKTASRLYLSLLTIFCLWSDNSQSLSPWSLIVPLLPRCPSAFLWPTCSLIYCPTKSIFLCAFTAYIYNSFHPFYSLLILFCSPRALASIYILQKNADKHILFAFSRSSFHTLLLTKTNSECGQQPCLHFSSSSGVSASLAYCPLFRPPTAIHLLLSELSGKIRSTILERNCKALQLLYVFGH